MQQALHKAAAAGSFSMDLYFMVDFNVSIVVAKIFACFVGILALLLTWRLVNFIKNFQLLHKQKLPDDSQFKWPKISMLIPVCNEENTLEQAAKSLFSMDYPNLEFIFINDRSTDQTAKILSHLSHGDCSTFPHCA